MLPSRDNRGLHRQRGDVAKSFFAKLYSGQYKIVFLRRLNRSLKKSAIIRAGRLIYNSPALAITVVKIYIYIYALQKSIDCGVWLFGGSDLLVVCVESSRRN
jgi:hypothetical protein